MSDPVPQSSNAAKYATGNPAVRRLLDRFYGTLHDLVQPLDPSQVVDVGCGEGFALSFLKDVLPPVVQACDLSPEAVAHCQARHPQHEVQQASIYALPYEPDTADLVICLEVLEHLDEPERGLSELARVSRDHVVLSVPWEPWFQLGNLARGKYLAQLGNHPEHVQRWGQAAFARFLEQSGHFREVRVVGSFPWTLAHARLK